MSRAIVVRISESIVRTIHVEDGVAAPLELLPILPAERMAEHLAAALAERGFARVAAACVRQDGDGTEIVVDLAAATIGVKLGAATEIAEAVELSQATAPAYEQRIAAGLRDDAARALEDQVAARTEEIRRAVTARLEAKLGDLRRELDAAIGRATAAALAEKAAQLGHIEEMHEDEAGNVTIRVRL
ncbi:MAG TPA: hypothetical protein VFP84_11060 [Kofleriaceae bacterium]|nr:hypothetical protein [Kofleriaceae bacterium]